MRKNVQRVFEAFARFKADKRDRSIWTDGKVVYSYDTCLLVADPTRRSWVLNTTRYSPTTTQHQRALRSLLEQTTEVPVDEVMEAPMGVTSAELVALARQGVAPDA